MEVRPQGARGPRTEDPEEGSGQVAQEEEERRNDDGRPRAPAGEVAEQDREHLRRHAARSVDKQRDDLGVVQRLAEVPPARRGRHRVDLHVAGVREVDQELRRILGQAHQPIAQLEVEGKHAPLADVVEGEGEQKALSPEHFLDPAGVTRDDETLGLEAQVHEPGPVHLIRRPGDAHVGYGRGQSERAIPAHDGHEGSPARNRRRGLPRVHEKERLRGEGEAALPDDAEAPLLHVPRQGRLGRSRLRVGQDLPGPQEKEVLLDSGRAAVGGDNETPEDFHLNGVEVGSHHGPDEERAHGERRVRHGGEKDLGGRRVGDQRDQREGDPDRRRAQMATDRRVPGGSAPGSRARTVCGGRVSHTVPCAHHAASKCATGPGSPAPRP